MRLGAKVRLLADPANLARFSMLPLVSLPAARGERQLGSGDADYTLTLMTGADVGPRAHIDTNYSIGAIGSGGGRRHYVAARRVGIDERRPDRAIERVLRGIRAFHGKRRTDGR